MIEPTLETAPDVASGDKRDGWLHQFSDVPLPEGVESHRLLYYKSECRPLYQLKPLHRRHHHYHSHDFRTWLEMRDRARKDLYWLGKECIATEQSGSGFVEHVHREMCSMFVQKNFDGVYHAKYTLDEVRQHFYKLPRSREMLLLAPRASYKSTVNKIDCVQWMLNAPDVRIFIITGSGGLSTKFLKEVKSFFYRPDRTEPTYFQALFPEYVIEGLDGVSAADLYCPARVCRQEGNPTLWVNSIDGRLAGWHCDLMKGDDVVNEGNSNTEETRAKLKDRYDNAAQFLPDQWAFRDQVGTRYAEDDWYGTRIADAEAFPETNAMQYLCRAAWTVKPEFADVPIRQLQEHMVELYFPEKMNFNSLIKECRSNEKTFRCQKLNEPAGADTIIRFERTAIERHTIIMSRVPRPPQNETRQVVCSWDTAHTAKIASDYSSGAVGYCDKPKRSLYVLEVKHGKWGDPVVARNIVDLHIKWSAAFSSIEKFGGWELLRDAIQTYANAKYARAISLQWRDIDVSFGSKRNRIRGLETLLREDRLWFVNGDWMDDLTQQFVRFSGFNKKRKDDIPDSIAPLQKLIPPVVGAPDPDAPVETQRERLDREARELREKFAAAQSDVAYASIFQPSTPPQITFGENDWKEAPPEPVAANEPPVDPGAGWIFGRTGIHL
jgi:phage terminase large subunit-like protein